MNSNAAHNILNLFGAVVGSLVMFDWAGLGLDPKTAATVAGSTLLADKIIKFSINLSRDGITGLFAPQPPVQK